MPTILAICEYGTVSGGENSLMAGIPLLRERGYQLEVLCPAGSDLAERLARLNVRTWPLTWRDAAEKTLPLEHRRTLLLEAIQRIGPDIVHANSLSVSRALGPLTDDLAIPTVGHIRDIVNTSGQVMRDVSRLSRVLCVSAATRDHHVRRGLDTEKSFVLYNGVELPEPVATQSADPLVVAAVGQLVQRKGIDVLIGAMPAIVARHPQIELRIYGERYSVKGEAIEYVEAIARRIAELGLESHVRLMGFHPDIQTCWPEIDLLVHPARQEPFGRVLLEAAAAGIPIVATDVGGTREMFPNQEATLVPPDDAAGLAAAVAELVDSPMLRQSRGHLGRERAGYFSCARYTEGLVRHYEELRG
ncbi:MAG: glycosyltransferase family 4 protein [Pirellulaceae bacterium]